MLVVTPYPVVPGSVIRCRPVGILNMTDEAGKDAKLVAVPHTKLTKIYDNVKDVNDLPELLLAQIKHFFEHYKELEAGKWVKLMAGMAPKLPKPRSSNPSKLTKTPSKPTRDWQNSAIDKKAAPGYLDAAFLLWEPRCKTSEFRKAKTGAPGLSRF